MDFFGIDINILVTVVGSISISAIIIAIIYFFYYKPRADLPLDHERNLRYWTIWLKEYGTHTGYVTTAMQTIQNFLSRIVGNETNKTEIEHLEATKTILKKFSAIAQKFDGKTYIYLCNHNPEDQKYLSLDPDRDDGYILNGVSDVLNVGEWDGMTFMALKLGSDFTLFSEEEKKAFGVGLDAVKYLRDVAKNTDKLKFIKEELSDKTIQLEKTSKELGETRSKLDRALSALSQKPLTQAENVSVPGAWKEKVKFWFGSPWQFGGAIIAFLAIGPVLLALFNWKIEPIFFNALIAVVGFFSIPIGKKLFGRWL